jgi:hypothetical protein
MFSSQSVLINSQTNIFLFLESISNQTLKSEEFACAQNAMQNNFIVVDNLTAPQITELYQHANPNVFFPRIGLFTADFALGTVLNQR